MSAATNYDKLRAAIVRGDIAPDARLVEADVSATFGMSRGAVRTALIRLEQDGLVVREPHRGARVRKVSDEEAVEILQARAVLEGLAVRQTAERIDDRGAARVQACLERHSGLLAAGDLLGASDANAELHATLLEISRHGTARRLIRALSSQTVRYQYRTILIPGPLGGVAGGAQGDRRCRPRGSPRRGRGGDAQPSVQRRRGRAARAAPGRRRQCEPRCAVRSRGERCVPRRRGGRSTAGGSSVRSKIVDNIGADLVDSNIREPGWPSESRSRSRGPCH